MEWVESVYIEIDWTITAVDLDKSTVASLIEMRRRAVDYTLQLSENGEVKANCPLSIIHFKQ